MRFPRGFGITVAVALTVAACATRVRVPEIPVLDSPAFKAASREQDPKPPVQVVEMPKPLPLPGQLKPVPEKKEKPKDDRQPKDRVKDANADARVEPVKDGYINAIQVYPYTKGALYQLYAAPAQVTDIALEPGEKLVSVFAGDTVRWVVGDTTSGEGREAQVHILVKPIGADLETNLVIATDRRTYHLEMRSSASTYMASVSWTYPASELLALNDGTPEPPARHRRKRTAWLPNNGAARLVRKNPADHLSGPSFALHLGNFGSGDVTVVEAYRTITMDSTLSYAILDRPRPGQTAVLQDESGIHSLLHLADTEDDAAKWLDAHPHRNARIVPATGPEPRLFTYLQDPGHGWLIVSRADLAAAGMIRAEFSICSYVSGDCLALEEDFDMPLFLKRLGERGIAWRLREHHTNADARVRCWEANVASEAAGRPAET